MIVTCTPSGPVWPRLIQHELLVVLEFDNIVTNDWYILLIFQWSLYDIDIYRKETVI